MPTFLKVSQHQYTEEGSKEEFLTNFMCQLIFVPFAIIAYNIGMEIGMEFFKGILTISPKLIEYEFRKLDKRIEQNIFTYGYFTI